MSTEHIARARRAKAVALATVLADTSAIDDPRCVHDLSVPGWELAAAEATKRGLLGQDSRGRNRTVHVPNSHETVAAVERELRMLQVEQRVDVEQPRTDAGRPGQPTEADAERAFVRTGDPFRVTDVRKATDSQGYRREMARIAPLPEDPFAGFPREDAIR